MATRKQDTSARDFASFDTDIVQSLPSGKSLGGKDGMSAKLIKHVVEKHDE